jgi:hypothetical protein
VTDEPDLMAELDDAERIMTGEVEKIVTEWGVRQGSDTYTLGEYGPAGGQRARCLVADFRRAGRPATLVSRKVTYGAWQDA